jgi:hypothetical protein
MMVIQLRGLVVHLGRQYTNRIGIWQARSSIPEFISAPMTHLDKGVLQMITHTGTSNFIHTLYDLKNLLFPIQ